MTSKEPNNRRLRPFRITNLKISCQIFIISFLNLKQYITIILISQLFVQSMKVSKIQSPKLTATHKKRKDSDKESPSTAAPNSPGNCSGSEFKSQEDLWALNCEHDKIYRMKTTLDALEGQQEQMKERFDKIVEFLVAQVNKNNEDNKRLAQEVKSLKKEVKQCNEDILAIESMIQPSFSRVRIHHQRGQEENSIDRMHARNLSKSKSRGLLASTRSSERIPLSKRISGKVLKSGLNSKI